MAFGFFIIVLSFHYCGKWAARDDRSSLAYFAVKLLLLERHLICNVYV